MTTGVRPRPSARPRNYRAVTEWFVYCLLSGRGFLMESVRIPGGLISAAAVPVSTGDRYAAALIELGGRVIHAGAEQKAGWR